MPAHPKVSTVAQPARNTATSASVRYRPRMTTHRHAGLWCGWMPLGEANTRFLLLVIILAFYMVFGTFLLYYLEHDSDVERTQYYEDFWRNFTSKYGHIINESDLNILIKGSGNHMLPMQSRPRPTIYQMFYLAFTTCATVGFGHVVPETVAGRAVIIIYGLFGCSAVILFYNLFLERIITLLALVLRTVHEFKMRKKYANEQSKNPQSGRRNSTNSRSSSSSLESWKPSVYWVMVCLFCLVTVITLFSSWMFSKVEGWTYFEAFYYSFITYATVGFGDLVSANVSTYGAADSVYRLANFVIMIVGISSLYSLFNVISIIIKHGLNWIIKKLDQKCQCACQCDCLPFAKVQTGRRRNAIIPNVIQQRRPTMDTDRRYSEEVIDVREFLQATKVSLAVMQKDLFESAQRGRTGFIGQLATPRAPATSDAVPSPRDTIHLRNLHAHSTHHHRSHDHLDKDPDFTPGNIGPLAIVEHTLGDD
ncbi:potassium channel subfamily K member 13-like [Paramacrobiotus metropolitanus]|uniref:potassium channel subfamily K member 13-like n=1 Tax=Paramacrobiotus metropolitanus TaxID=2943436 RepID=UPI002445D3F8|nr:potassium channel subfamily K member 13-like [Paramacrobiotus metropolitanus]XP_055331801.1 potassium channel subfamily K member 13-like [Paramacrobiotus metropolitanus]